MTAFDPAVDAALAGTIVRIAGCIEIILPSYNLRLADAGVVKFGDGRMFVSDDTTFGSIASIETITDGTGDQAPVLNLSLYPKTDAAAADLAAANMQSSAVTMWLVVLDEVTGAVVGIPEPVFIGMLDVATLKTSEHGRQLDFEITSMFEDFFTTDDAARMTDSFHRVIWPNDKGLEFMTTVKRTVYWGAAAPTNGIDKAAGGFKQIFGAHVDIPRL